MPPDPPDAHRAHGHEDHPGDPPGSEEAVASEPFETRRAREFRQAVLRKSVRRSRARRERPTTVWTYLSFFGLVGWTVAVPTLLGLALGLYLDSVLDTDQSLAVTFLVVGVTVGCAMAWYWIRRESEER